MISTVLVELRGLAGVVSLVVCLGSACLGWVLVRRGARGRSALRVLGVLAVLPALGLTLVPSGDPPALAFCAVDFSWPIPPSSVQAAEIAMLLPAVLLLSLTVHRPWLVLLGGFVLVLLIELAQALVPVLGRSCDTDDIWLNTLGVVFGAAAAALIGVVRRRRTTAPGRAEDSDERSDAAEESGART